MPQNPIRMRSKLLRLPEVLGRIPVSRSSWYEGVRLGLYPQPVRIGKRTVAWRDQDIEKLESGFVSS